MDMKKMPSGMDHSKMQHSHDAHKGMAEHDHHAMMIADFKKRFLCSATAYYTDHAAVHADSAMAACRSQLYRVTLRAFCISFCCVCLWWLAVFNRVGRRGKIEKTPA
jgi:uncharacterized protein involved in copper resistance